MVSHLIKQPYLEAKGGRVLVAELQVNAFPNIQTGLGLETDAGVADVGADPISRNLAQYTLVNDPHRHVDPYPVLPAPLVRNKSGCRRRRVWRNRVLHSGVIGKNSASFSFPRKPQPALPSSYNEEFSFQQNCRLPRSSLDFSLYPSRDGAHLE